MSTPPPAPEPNPQEVLLSLQRLAICAALQLTELRGQAQRTLLAVLLAFLTQVDRRRTRRIAELQHIACTLDALMHRMALSSVSATPHRRFRRIAPWPQPHQPRVRLTGAIRALARRLRPVVRFLHRRVLPRLLPAPPPTARPPPSPARMAPAPTDRPLAGRRHPRTLSAKDSYTGTICGVPLSWIP